MPASVRLVIRGQDGQDGGGHRVTRISQALAGCEVLVRAGGVAGLSEVDLVPASAMTPLDAVPSVEVIGGDQLILPGGEQPLLLLEPPRLLPDQRISRIPRRRIIHKPQSSRKSRTATTATPQPPLKRNQRSLIRNFRPKGLNVYPRTVAIKAA